jgi:hypothetical protein
LFAITSGADQGIAAAQNHSGNCHLKGEDIRIDFQGPASYLKLAANQGIAAQQVFIEFANFASCSWSETFRVQFFLKFARLTI